MYRLLVATLKAASVVALTASTSPASARQYRQGYVVSYDRYCLQGRLWGYPGNCQFATYEACLASASGTDAYCGINPAYAFARDRAYRGGWQPY